MEKKRKSRINGDLSDLILLSLLKEGPLTIEQLEENTALQSVHFDRDRQERHRANRERLDLVSTCEGMVDKKLLTLTDNSKYTLTVKGRIKAVENAKAMEKGAAMLENQFLSPSAAARNTAIGFVVLAAIKLAAGFFTASVGLIADGADTTVDTAASSIVWCGIKFKKEILGTIAIIALMFVTAVNFSV